MQSGAMPTGALRARGAGLRRRSLDASVSRFANRLANINMGSANEMGWTVGRPRRRRSERHLHLGGAAVAAGLEGTIDVRAGGGDEAAPSGFSNLENAGSPRSPTPGSGSSGDGWQTTGGGAADGDVYLRLMRREFAPWLRMMSVVCGPFAPARRASRWGRAVAWAWFLVGVALVGAQNALFTRWAWRGGAVATALTFPLWFILEISILNLSAAVYSNGNVRPLPGLVPDMDLLFMLEDLLYVVADAEDGAAAGEPSRDGPGAGAGGYAPTGGAPPDARRRSGRGGGTAKGGGMFQAMGADALRHGRAAVAAVDRVVGEPGGGGGGPHARSAGGGKAGAFRRFVTITCVLLVGVAVGGAGIFVLLFGLAHEILFQTATVYELVFISVTVLYTFWMVFTVFGLLVCKTQLLIECVRCHTLAILQRNFCSEEVQQSIEENRRLNEITRNWSTLWERTVLVVAVCVLGIIGAQIYAYFRVFEQNSGLYSLFLIALSVSVLLLVAIIVGRVTAAFAEVSHTINHSPFEPPYPEEEGGDAADRAVFDDYVLARNSVIVYLTTANIAWRFFGIRVTWKLIASAVHGMVQLGGVAIMIKVRTDFIGDKMAAQIVEKGGAAGD